MREIRFRAWVKKDSVMIGHRETIERAHLQFNDDLGGHSDIVMQYTGLKDKNGKEIYEGDILNYEDTENITDSFVEPVEWDEFMGGWVTKSSSFVFGGVARLSEVIGNVHQNPELLDSK